MLRPVDLLHLRQFGKLVERFADDAAFHLADRHMHPEQSAGTSRNSSMKQLVQTPVRSLSAPNAIGSTKPPSPPIMPTRPPTAPTCFG